MNRKHAVRVSRIDFQGRVLNQLRLQQDGVLERHDLIVIALDYQGRHADCLQIVGLISFRERLDAEVVRDRGTHHALSPPIVDNTLDNLRARTIESVERYWHLAKEL